MKNFEYFIVTFLLGMLAMFFVVCLIILLTGCKHIPIPGVDQHEPNHKIIQNYP